MYVKISIRIMKLAVHSYDCSDERSKPDRCAEGSKSRLSSMECWARMCLTGAGPTWVQHISKLKLDTSFEMTSCLFAAFTTYNLRYCRYADTRKPQGAYRYGFVEFDECEYRKYI